MAGILSRSFIGFASRITSLWQLWIITLLSRCLLTTVMALSAFYVPQLIYFDPGDDVLRFGTSPDKSETCSAFRSWTEFWTIGLTRWDAARFLHLAQTPQLRYSDDPEIAERAHAFLPGYPTMIQMVSQFLQEQQSWSASLSDGTILVLASWIINTISSLVAVTSLYFLTRQLAEYHHPNSNQSNAVSFKTAASPHQLATYAALLFIGNPASVFFVAAYSEAFFAALAWTGAYFVMLGHHNSPSRPKNGIFALVTSWLHSGIGLVFWMAATATRSNGMLYAGYWLLYGLLGRVSCGSYESLPRSVLATLGYFLAMVFIFLPLIWYNDSTIQQLCSTASSADPSSTAPEWCEGRSPWFYLYGYVQRKHWNVGFLRYFTPKQIPNFLLATPILSISALGVSSWIENSWKEYLDDSSAVSGSKTTIGGPIAWLGHVWSWAWWALERASRSDVMSPTQSPVLGPLMLPHYAIWAVVALLGLTTAHVQISTRLLCSTCPALYWYLASTVESMSETTKPASEKQPLTWSRFDFVLVYCLLYTVLGVLLHPNWLPWT